MMRKVGNQKPFWSPQLDPATIGRSCPSNKSAKIAALREAGLEGEIGRRPAGLLFLGAAKARGSQAARRQGGPRLRLITQQSEDCFGVSIKAAPMVGNFLSRNGGALATLAMAQALTSPRLLPRVQKQKCLQIIQEMILFSSGCTRGVHGRYRFQ
jgi:hypothetical protein